MNVSIVYFTAIIVRHSKKGWTVIFWVNPITTTTSGIVPYKWRLFTLETHSFSRHIGMTAVVICRGCIWYRWFGIASHWDTLWWAVKGTGVRGPYIGAIIQGLTHRTLLAKGIGIASQGYFRILVMK